ncbi:MAG: prolipoprotein diacylglyceryl transferase [Armatimonadota bacterium]|nr:prolipoprotein diacylglyceryl transferase [Armatimonadota bacterium]
MNPVIVQFGPIAIRWYGVMVALTILGGTALAYRFGRRFGIPQEAFDRLLLPFVIVLVAGARLGYVLSHPAEFTNPLEILRIDRGGLSSHGALAAGFLYLTTFARRHQLSVWAMADAIVPAIPLGNVLIRFGNFMNGELYGDPTSLPWGIVFPGVPGGPRHPLQLYEMAAGAILLALCSPWSKARRFEGELFWKVILGTSLVRFGLDLLRSEARVAGPFTLGQFPALVLIVAAAWMLYRQDRAKT